MDFTGKRVGMIGTGSTGIQAAPVIAAAAAHLTIEGAHEIRVGFELQEKFPQSDAFYRQWHGLPIVLVVRARK